MEDRAIESTSEIPGLSAARHLARESRWREAVDAAHEWMPGVPSLYVVMALLGQDADRNVRKTRAGAGSWPQYAALANDSWMAWRRRGRPSDWNRIIPTDYTSCVGWRFRRVFFPRLPRPRVDS